MTTLLRALAVIFDFDGVLVNTESQKAEAWRKILGECGVQNGDAWYRSRMGRTRLDLCEEAVLSFRLSFAPGRLALRKQEVFREITKGQTEPIEPMITFAERLSRTGVALGIASSQHEDIIRRQLCMIGSKASFVHVVSIQDNGLPSKPDPGVYILAARRFGISPQVCIAVEDTDAGVAAAKDADMRCIGFRNRENSSQSFARADLIVSAEDLPNLDISARA